MKICPNCGVKNPDEAGFCENCGTSLQDVAAIAVTSEKPNTSTSENHGPKTEAKQAFSTSETTSASTLKSASLDKKQRNMLIGILAILILLFTGYKMGEKHFSKENQITAFTSAIAENKANKVQKFLTSDDDKLKITRTGAEAFLAYFKENGSELKSLKDNLKNDSSYLGVEMVKKGKTFLFFDRYRAEVESAYGTLASNQKNIKIAITGEKNITTDTEEFSKQIGPFVPGIYKVVATGKDANGEEMKLDQDVTFFNESDNYVDCSFTLMRIPITTNVDTATVYLNDEEVATTENGETEIGPFLYKEGMTLQLKSEMDSGEITTEPYELSDGEYDSSEDQYPLELDFDILTEDDVISGLDNFYSDFSYDVDATENYNSEDFASTYFEDGSSNEAFTGINDYINDCRTRSQKNEYNGVYFTTEIKDFKLIGENEYQMDYYVEYNTDYPYEISPDTRVQGFDYKGVKVKASYDEDYNLDFKFVDMGDGGTKSFDNQPDKA